MINLIVTLFSLLYNLAIDIIEKFTGWQLRPDIVPEEPDKDLEVLNYGYFKSMQPQYPDRTDEITGLIKERDPEFSPEEFLEYAKKIFNEVGLAMSGKELSAIKSFTDDALYEKMSSEHRYDLIKEKYRLNFVEADKAFITSYERTAEYEQAAVFMTVRRIKWKDLGRREKLAVTEKTDDVNIDIRYRLKFRRTSPYESWTLQAHEIMRYSSVDEGIKTG